MEFLVKKKEIVSRKKCLHKSNQISFPLNSVKYVIDGLTAVLFSSNYNSDVKVSDTSLPKSRNLVSCFGTSRCYKDIFVKKEGRIVFKSLATSLACNGAAMKMVMTDRWVDETMQADREKRLSDG